MSRNLIVLPSCQNGSVDFVPIENIISMHRENVLRKDGKETTGRKRYFGMLNHDALHG